MSDELQAASDEMIENSQIVVEELIERAITTTSGGFTIHIWAWIHKDGPDAFRIRVAGDWEPRPDSVCDIVRHDFGEEPPWPVVDPASTPSTNPASPGVPDGDATATTP